MTSEKERPQREAFAGKKKQMPGTRSLLAGILAWLFSAFFLQILAPSSSDIFSPALAAGKEKDKDKKDKDKDKDNGGGNANAAGNGNGKDKEAKEKEDKAKGKDEGPNSVDNGITEGNGVAIGLGEGVGLGIGVGNSDTIGFGIGISVDGSDKHRSLESFDRDKGRSGSGKSERDDWARGKGNGKGHKHDADKLDLGKQFDVDRIKKGLGSDLDELGKLLTNDAPQNGITGAGEGALMNAPSFAKKPESENAKGDIETGRPINAEKATKADVGRGSKAEKEAEKASKESEKEAEKAEKEAEKEARKAEKEAEKEAKKAAKEADKDAKKASKDEETVETPDSASSPPAADRRNVAGNNTVNAIQGSYVAHEVLAVGLNPRSISRARQLGFSINETGLEQEQGALLTLYTPTGIDSLRAITLLRRELPRDAFHLNWIYRPYNAAQDDPEGPQIPPDQPGGGGGCVGDKCYGRAAIGWNEKLNGCARGINVGVIDTDVDLGHPAFSGQKITRRTFVADGKQSSANGHGTGVLALLAGGRDSGTPGLIPEAQFFFADVFFTDSNGETITDTVSLLKALEWLEGSRTKIVNMSFSGPEDGLVQVRLKSMRARGVAFTAAAGNQGPAAVPSYPAAYPEVVAVTAVGKDMRVYVSANRGPYVDVAAPGVRIWTAIPGARGGYKTGTSFAAPFATAILALQQPDSLSAAKEELLDRMKAAELGPKGRDPIYGRGLLQAPEECSGLDAPVSVFAPATKVIRR
jgi:hypothetical protein